MVGTGIFNVPTLGDGAVILCVTLGGAVFSTVGVTDSPILCAGDVSNTIGGAPGLFRRD